MIHFSELVKNSLNPEGLSNLYVFSAAAAVRRASFLKLDIQDDIITNRSVFEQNVQLKRVLRNHISEDIDNAFEVYFWIIQHWGGIHTFKDNVNGKNRGRIRTIINNLENGINLDDDTFSRISSLSKVASFKDPARYAIYDARAIYTLNWIISKMLSVRSDFEISYFPMKSSISRNNLIKERPFELIYNRYPKHKIYPKGIAYTKYCELLRELTPYIFPENPFEIFRTEMLLFASIEIAYLDLAF